MINQHGRHFTVWMIVPQGRSPFTAWMGKWLSSRVGHPTPTAPPPGPAKSARSPAARMSSAQITSSLGRAARTTTSDPTGAEIAVTALWVRLPRVG